MFAHRLLNPLALVLLVAVPGCNSAHVMQKNIERTAQNWGKPKDRPWPMHPYAPATAGSPRKDDRRFASPVVQEDEPEREDDEEEIIQTGGQMPSNTGIIAGRVVDSSGRPQPNVSVVATATRRPGSQRADVTTDARGNFVLRGLEPGQRYLILASAIRNSSSLIGRVSSVPPDQGVVIEIAAPFTANRETTPRPIAQREPTRPMAPAAETESSRGNPRAMHSQNPFAAGKEFAETKATARNNAPAAAPSQPPKRTREQALADNRLDSPWDMPAPSTRRTPASAANKPPQVASSDKSDTPWKPAGGGRPVQLSGKPREKVLKTPPPEVASTEPGEESSDTHDATDSNSDPRRPLSQPLEIPANAKPDRPRTLVTKANVPLEGQASGVSSQGSGVSNPLPDPRSLTPDSSLPQHPLHDGPMCEFDGKRLVDFQLADAQGQPVSFGGINGHFVLIDFWTTWCGPCLRAMPHLVSLQRRYGPQGLQVVGIACEQGSGDERIARVLQIGDQLGINYPLLLDEGGDKFMVRDKFGVGVYPTLILLDKSGNVLWRSEGPDQADMQQLEKLLKTQLATTSTGYN